MIREGEGFVVIKTRSSTYKLFFYMHLSADVFMQGVLTFLRLNGGGDISEIWVGDRSGERIEEWGDCCMIPYWNHRRSDPRRHHRKH